jgi:hypothetical protein
MTSLCQSKRVQMKEMPVKCELVKVRYRNRTHVHKYIPYFLLFSVAVYMGTEYLNNRVFEEIISKFQSSEKAIVRHRLIMQDWQDASKRKNERGVDVGREARKVKQHEDMYRSALSENDISRNELAIAFYTLSEHLVRYAKFQLIEDDDAVQEGVLICFDKVDRFDPRKGKAFNYMTTCILNHFRQMYRTARNYNELKKKYLTFLKAVGDQVAIQNGRERPKSYKSSLYSA